MVNLGNPDLAFRTAMLPNDGVGLARMEFIISEHIGVHPMALVHPEKLTARGARAHRIAQRATSVRRASSSCARWPRASARSPRRSIRSR